LRENGGLGGGDCVGRGFGGGVLIFVG